VSSFTTPLHLEPLEDGRRWRLVSEFVYAVGDENSAWRITVPAGFVTDFASVPRVFWGLMPPWDQYGKAAVLHDYLYSTGSVSRLVADAVFLEAMAVLCVPRWKRVAIYSAVRWFGGLAYAA